MVIFHSYVVRDPEDPEDWSFQPAASYIWSVQKWEDSNFPTDFVSLPEGT